MPVGRSAGEDRVQIADARVGDPTLRAADQPAVAIGDGLGGHRCHIAAGVGLAEPVAALAFTAGDTRDVGALQLLGTEVDDGQHAQLRDEELQAGRRTRTRQLFARDRLIDQRGTRPAVLLGIAERGQLHGLQRLERGPRVLGAAVDLGGQRGDLVGHELPKHGPEFALGIRQGHSLPLRLTHGAHASAHRANHML